MNKGWLDEHDDTDTRPTNCIIVVLIVVLFGVVGTLCVRQEPRRAGINAAAAIDRKHDCCWQCECCQ